MEGGKQAMPNPFGTIIRKKASVPVPNFTGFKINFCNIEIRGSRFQGKAFQFKSSRSYQRQLFVIQLLTAVGRQLRYANSAAMSALHILPDYRGGDLTDNMRPKSAISGAAQPAQTTCGFCKHPSKTI
jgi:hypothetical protein